VDIKSKDYAAGFAAAIVLLYDVFDSRSNALHNRGVRRKDLRLILAVIDAMLRARDKLSTIGPRNMDLVLKRDGSAEFVERKNGKT
jgi:hypothetical protein